MSFNIDITIFSIFIIVNLVVGLFASRGINSITKYAISHRNFATSTIVATLIASCVDASLLSCTLTETYRQGIKYIIPFLLGDGLMLFLMGYIFVPRMGEFLGDLSIAESMGKLFGSKARFITSVASVILSVGILSVEFKVSSQVLELIFGVSGMYATFASALIVVIYSTFGGIKSVTFTDVIQFITFGCIIPIIFSITWDSIGDNGLREVLTTHPNFDFNQLISSSDLEFWRIAGLFFFFLIPDFCPMVFQRILIAKNTLQASKAFKIAGVTFLAIQVLIACIGVFVFAHNPNLDPNEIMIRIITDYGGPGFKGIMAICIMACIMSTADSLINSAAVIFAHDLCKPSGFKWAQNELLVAKAFSVLSSICALYLALRSTDILDLILSAWNFYMPIVSIPFILAIFGFRSSEKSVLTAMLAAGTSVIVLQYIISIPEAVTLMISSIIHVTFLFGSHYLLKQPGGWVGIKDQNTWNTFKQDKKAERQELINSIVNFSFVDFCKANTPKNELAYVYFGLYSIVSLLISIYSIPASYRSLNYQMIMYLSNASLIFSSYFLTYFLWPRTFKNATFTSTSWFFACFFVLICAPCLLALISNFGPSQLITLCINIVVLSLLFKWQAVLFMIASGTYLSTTFFYNFMYSEHFVIDSTLSFNIVYMLLLSGSVVVAFLKPIQQTFAFNQQSISLNQTTMNELSKQIFDLKQVKQEFLNNVSHEIRTPIHHIGTGSEALTKNWNIYNDQQKQEFVSMIHQGYLRISEHMNNILDFSKLSINKFDLSYAETNLADLIYSTIHECKSIYLNEKEIQFIVAVETDNPTIECDPSKINQALKHLIKNAIDYSTSGTVEIVLSDAILKLHDFEINALKISIIDEGLGIPPDEVRSIFGPFSQSSYTKKMSGGKGLGLALTEKIVTMHHGHIWAENNINRPGSTFYFILPLFNPTSKH